MMRKDLYEAADANGVVVVGDQASSMGVVGGYVQGGGHGPLSHYFGLATDNVLQFTVVTPDARIRIANKCQNQEIFWALGGGGAGTFGIVIWVIFAAFPVLQNTINASYIIGPFLQIRSSLQRIPCAAAQRQETIQTSGRISCTGMLFANIWALMLDGIGEHRHGFWSNRNCRRLLSHSSVASFTEWLFLAVATSGYATSGQIPEIRLWLLIIQRRGLFAIWWNISCSRGKSSEGIIWNLLD